MPNLSSLVPEQIRSVLGSERLDLLLREQLEAARAAHSDISLTESIFVKHLATKLSFRSTEEEIRNLEGADLYLALACTRGDPQALLRLDSRLLAGVEPDIRRVVTDEDTAGEVLQRLRIGLCLSIEGQLPKLLSYDGRGPLLSWLRTTAIRAALSALRAVRGEVGAEEDLIRLSDHLAAPDLLLMRQRHQEDLKQAFFATLRELSAKERMVLRLRHLDGMSLEDISGVLGLHRSTVIRTLESLRAGLVEGTRRRMKARLLLGSRDLDSLLTEIRSGLNLSLDRMLGQFEV